MAETGYSRSPKLSKGAIVQFVQDIVVPIPSIIPFQYNPERLKRTLTPWDPREIGDQARGQLAPTAQPFDPKETISLRMELDASDQLEESDAIATQFGVADRIAALELLLYPAASPLGALGAAAAALLGGGAPQPPERSSVPITLLILGIGRILPVRITSYSIEEIQFLPNLQPLVAEIDLAFEVLTPDVFKCQSGASVEIAKAAYNWFRTQQSALAVVQTAKNAGALLSLLPF